MNEIYTAKPTWTNEEDSTLIIFSNKQTLPVAEVMDKQEAIKIQNACNSRDDMLAALKEAVNLVDDETIRVRPSDRRKFTDWLEHAYAAIAKAEGRTE